ncbi:MAG: hypothetical protein GC200_01145 [Tepidisphaera sp.]|nr:hypothetical protein [Tepidisphaera sp.]
MARTLQLGIISGLAALAGLACDTAQAQLRPDEVLVVYDSRNPDSKTVAEYYAGSAAVPGGVGGLRGARPGVRTFDLATSGQPLAPAGNISYANFVTQIRNPIRTFLTNNSLAQTVRCLVTTKGMPHRVQDTTNPNAGDDPNALITEYSNSDATMAATDAELALLWINLDTGEAGGSGDSLSDGVVQNPYWRQTTPIRAAFNTNIQANKVFLRNGTGPTWLPQGTSTNTYHLNPGDIYLVSRLDGLTVADVEGMIDRARNIYYDTTSMAVLLDESGSNGIADATANLELDNSNTGFPPVWDSDDYETTRDELLADHRFAPAFTQYNAAAGGAQFFVGPRLSWSSGILINQPVVLVASYGANHSGLPSTTGGTSAATIYATSYNYPNGAIFNTIESYNGRDFGGLGQRVGIAQQQASSFIAAGGTFAIGNVWEPLADTVGDNRYLSRNFIRGNLSWGEAAMSAIPALSWQQMALGDPLARAFRSSEDVNHDQRVTVDDLYTWEASPSDVNGDGSVNTADRQFIVDAVRSWERAELTTGRQ